MFGGASAGYGDPALHKKIKTAGYGQPNGQPSGDPVLQIIPEGYARRKKMRLCAATLFSISINIEKRMINMPTETLL